MMSQFWTASPLLMITVPGLQMSLVSCSHVVPLQRRVTALWVTPRPINHWNKFMSFHLYLILSYSLFNFKMLCGYFFLKCISYFIRTFELCFWPCWNEINKVKFSICSQKIWRQTLKSNIRLMLMHFIHFKAKNAGDLTSENAGDYRKVTEKIYPQKFILSYWWTVKSW